MQGVMSDQDKLFILFQQLQGLPFSASLQMGLLAGVLPTFTHNTDLAIVTPFEVTFGGYSRQAVSGWTTPFLTGDFHAFSTANPVTFGNSSGSASPSITGWFVLDVPNTALVMAGKWDNPFVIPNGGSFSTTPTWQLTGE